MCNKALMHVHAQDNVVSFIGHYGIRTCHKVKWYHKGHKTFVELGCIIRTLCGMDNKTRICIKVC